MLSDNTGKALADEVGIGTDEAKLIGGGGVSPVPGIAKEYPPRYARSGDKSTPTGAGKYLSCSVDHIFSGKIILCQKCMSFFSPGKSISGEGTEQTIGRAENHSTGVAGEDSFDIFDIKQGLSHFALHWY